MSQENRIRATEMSFRILDEVHRRHGATAEELTEATGLSRAGVYKHLRTLVRLDALTNRDGVYELGPKLTQYRLQSNDAQFVVDQTDRIETLAQSLDAPITLWVHEDERCNCTYVSQSEGREGFPRQRGDSESLTESPPGKAVLAHLPTEQREELIGPDESLPEQLEQLRERQLLEERLSEAPKWVSISTPVLNPSDEPVAAIEVVIPNDRASSIDVKNNIRGLLTEAANQIRVGML
ncbi:IclR family transcriptional regulator [Haloferax sp. AS1]|uniref:helix-turn-helix domain-containing protein n=1 Tax=Haloferax sp. AS1 TaxID=2562277 RepID=UPI00165F5492|nr:IclR family transcriptional regulator C-terminal domain-containing protein [Haloferax sp. AS1]MBC9987984.1 IclR family transcriptional regulator [Haloferax sp. AS1]